MLKPLRDWRIQLAQDDFFADVIDSEGLEHRVARALADEPLTQWENEWRKYPNLMAHDYPR